MDIADVIIIISVLFLVFAYAKKFYEECNDTKKVASDPKLAKRCGYS